MSKIKNKNILISILLVLISFFAFGCENKTPVEDIYFNLGQGQDQIVLLTGQTLQLDNFVSFQPSYATNKDYDIISQDTSVVQVNGKSLIAVSEGNVTIKIVSKDNDRKQDVVSVAVKNSVSVLKAPSVIKYNELNQTLTFNPVTNASSYTLNVNGQEINLGNSTTFSLKDLDNPYNKVLAFKIKANAPEYSFALKTSEFSNEYKIYQASQVANAKVQGGILSFNSSDNNVAKIYFDDALFVETEATNVDLKQLEESYAGKNFKLKIVASPSLSIKEEYGDTVDKYCDSYEVSTEVAVLDATQPKMYDSVINWDHVAGASSYDVLINETKVANVEENTFNLVTLNNFSSYTKKNSNYIVKVVPVIGAESKNILSTTKQTFVEFNRLETPRITLLDNSIEWSVVDYANVYKIVLIYGNNRVEVSTVSNSCDLSAYPSGMDYAFSVQALSVNYSGVNYLSSIVAADDVKGFRKQAVAKPTITDYVLICEEGSNDSYYVEFDIDGKNTYANTLKANNGQLLDLSTYNFTAGTHTIKVVHLGDKLTSVNSNEAETSFVQLEQIKDISIANNTVSVEKGTINTDAKVTLKTESFSLTDPIVKEGLSITFENLDAGNYTTSVYVEGDGEKTFSYRDLATGKLLTSCYIEFKVLEIPTWNKLANSALENLTFTSVANAYGYKIYNTTTTMEDYKTVNTNNFDFELGEGSIKFKVQAIGNKTNVLDSKLSNEVTINRLAMPTLTFNNETNVISKQDTITSYIFTENGTPTSYNFNSAIDLNVGENVFTLIEVAELGTNTLNSNAKVLTITKLDATTTFAVEDNYLKLTATHVTEYDLSVIFTFANGDSKEFVSNDNKLVNGNVEIPYVYENGSYVFSLIDDEYKAYEEGFKSDFTVKVKYIQPSSGNDTIANSDYSADSSEFKIEKIDATTSFVVENNKLKLTTQHDKEYTLNVVFTFANSETQEFVANGSNLVCDTIVIPYIYRDGTYTINLLDEEFNAYCAGFKTNFTAKVRYAPKGVTLPTDVDSVYSATSGNLIIGVLDAMSKITTNVDNQLVIVQPTSHDTQYNLRFKLNSDDTLIFVADNVNSEFVCATKNYTIPFEYEDGTYYIDLLDENFEPVIKEFGSNFTVSTQYSPNQEGLTTDYDSEFESLTSVTVLATATITRNEQNIQFNNVLNSYTQLNYSIIINGIYKIDLDNTILLQDNVFTIPVSYIYENVEQGALQDINSVAILTKNIETKDENCLASAKGEAVLIKKQQTLQLSYIKENDSENNSVVIIIDAIKTTYAKEYVVEIYNEGKTNKIVKKFKDENLATGVTSFTFNLDEVELSDTILVSAYIATVGQDTDTAYVFNSADSNVLSFEKVTAPTNVYVEGTTIHFGEVENAIGYEIYEKTGLGYVKLNDGIISSTSYQITSWSGEKVLAFKSISSEEGYTNSSYGELFTINKILAPTIVNMYGEFVIALPAEVVTLIETENVEITLQIHNKNIDPWQINLKDVDMEGILLQNNTLYIEAYTLLTYSYSVLTEETITFKYDVTYSSKDQENYYLSSNETTLKACGLFAPTGLKKTTDNNNTVEMLSWTPNPKNVLNGKTLALGYVFNVSYGSGLIPKTYTSADTRLKYYDAETKKYCSYPSIILENQAIFPYGFDENNDGVPEIVFGAGSYVVEIKTMASSQEEGCTLCSSDYSDEKHTFRILATPSLTVKQGSIVWDESVASKYMVSIRKDGSTTPTIDYTTECNYDFNNLAVASTGGLYYISVKAISTREDVLNSATSEEYMVYRMPAAESAVIDDGKLMLSANKYFVYAKITFIDTSSAYSKTIDFVNKNAEGALASLNIVTWSSLTETQKQSLAENVRYYIDVAKDLDAGRTYSISVKLYGNTSSALGIINSVSQTFVSELKLTKLKANFTGVNLGVVTFKPDGDYAEISQSGVYSGANLNYKFNSAESADFWKQTVIYQISVTMANSTKTIYAVDYYSFITAINKSVLSASEYNMLSAMNDLYATVKYNYVVDVSTESGTQQVTKSLLFNVYKNNTINLKDYDNLYYYGINVAEKNNEYWYTEDNTYTTIELASGGSFAIDVLMMGGDNYTIDNANGTTSNLGYVSSNGSNLKTFVRYGENALYTHNGMVEFINLCPLDINEIPIDYPVYQIKVTPINTTDTQYVYLYHTTETEAKAIASKIDANYQNAIYVPVEFSSHLENGLIFDLSAYFDAGIYKADIRTLAGIGNGEDEYKHYLLNAKFPATEFTFQKLTDAKFTSSQGFLVFDLSYINQDGQKIYCTDYEITLVDGTTEYVYNINKDTEGVAISNNRLTYNMPSSLSFNNAIVNILNDKEYKIKIKALASSNYVLNGTYSLDDNQDYLFAFKKSIGATEVRIEDGILKWVVVDMENYSSVNIEVTYKDEFNEEKEFYIIDSGVPVYNDSGVYQYHYYRFIEGAYSNVTTPYIYMVPNRDYGISLYTYGKTTETVNILNSNYSQPLTTQRLSTVDEDTIITRNGVLMWTSVPDAKNYIVYLLGNKNYVYTTASTSLELFAVQDDNGNYLETGDYSVQIITMGSNKINSVKSEEATDFHKLANVKNIRIQGNSIVWDTVQYAQAYRITFEYLNTSNKTVQTTETVIAPQTNYSTPNDIKGKFTITIQAIGYNDGKVFNGESSSFESSTNTPLAVSKITFNNALSRYEWSVTDDFLNGDKLLITYTRANYTAKDTIGAEEIVTEYISYMQDGNYFVQDGTTYYYYPLSIIAEYKNFTVQVAREGTIPSNPSVLELVSFRLFSYGNGTSTNPYRISTSNELLNIEYFANSKTHFELISAINMSTVDYASRISANNAIISRSFNGVLNGNGHSIHGFNTNVENKTDVINLTNATSFALFGTLNNATISNLTIGEENILMILSNMFAKNNSNVVSLSMIATGAINSTLQNINIRNLQIELNEDQSSSATEILSNTIYIGGLLATSNNSTITGCTAKIKVAVNIMFSADSYVAGLVARSTNTSISGCKITDANQNETAGVDFTVTLSKNRTLTYVGGIVAYFEGSAGLAYSVTNSIVKFAIENVKVSYLGGVVGFATRVNIDNVLSLGSITYAYAVNSFEIGGVVAYAQYSKISNSGTSIVFDVTIDSTTSKHLGAIAGSLIGTDNNGCVIENCYFAKYNSNQHSTTYKEDGSINVLGIYGYSESGTTITNFKNQK